MRVLIQEMKGIYVKQIKMVVDHLCKQSDEFNENGNLSVLSEF